MPLVGVGMTGLRPELDRRVVTEPWYVCRPRRWCASREPHGVHVFGVLGRGGPYCCHGRWSAEELGLARARAREMVARLAADGTMVANDAAPTPT